MPSSGPLGLTQEARKVVRALNRMHGDHVLIGTFTKIYDLPITKVDRRFWGFKPITYEQVNVTVRYIPRTQTLILSCIARKNDDTHAMQVVPGVVVNIARWTPFRPLEIAVSDLHKYRLVEPLAEVLYPKKRQPTG